MRLSVTQSKSSLVSPLSSKVSNCGWQFRSRNLNRALPIQMSCGLFRLPYVLVVATYQANEVLMLIECLKMLGSILSNILLVLGCSFLAGKLIAMYGSMVPQR